MKTALVTGVAGFLGCYVARHFAQAGWKVLGVDDVAPEKVDLPGVEYRRLKLPAEAFLDLLTRTGPTLCVHCAGCASVGASMEDPTADFRGNTLLVFEILEALRQRVPGCRFLLLSSAAVYGDPATLPITEGHAVHPLSPYGYHKRQAEMLCEEFSRIYGLPTAAARIFSAYGPGLRRQVVWDTCERVLKTGECRLHGTGAESRDFIHAEDVARGLRVLAEAAPCGGEIYNLASGREVTIAELAQTALAALGSKITPVFDGAATPGNPLHWRADIAKISALGFVPGVSFEDGLASVARWVREQIAAPLNRTT